MYVNFTSTGDIYEDFQLHTNWRHTYQLATSPVCRMLYFVAHVGLVGCGLEFLGRIGSGLGLGLGLVLGCTSPVDRICRYVCVCVCVRADPQVDL